MESTQSSSSNVYTTCVLALEAPNAQGNLSWNTMTNDVIRVGEGRDIREKILQHLKNAKKMYTFLRGHSFNATILTSLGIVRNITLHASGEDKYYEGYYSVITLRGEYFVQADGRVMELNKQTVMLSGPKFEVFGGEVLGCLVAGSPIELVLGYFPLA